MPFKTIQKDNTARLFHTQTSLLLVNQIFLTMQKRLVQGAFQKVANSTKQQRLFSVNKFCLSSAEDKVVFDWKDALCLDSLLTDEEKSIRDQV